MTLSEFLNCLYKYCGNGDTPANFMMAMFHNITSEQENDFFNKNNDELKRIFNGKKTIKTSSVSYILTHIDKHSFDCYLFELLSEDSLIELCNEFEPYIGNSTKENVTRKIADLLIDILSGKHAKENSVVGKNNNDINIYDEINVIVRKIAKLSLDEIENILKYDAYKVDKKILDTNAVLKKEVKNNVIDYYTFIEKIFADLDDSQIFDKFASQVKQKCDEYIEDNLPQQLIFDNMCNWLKERTQSTNQTACRIIIAFFVQNCEVFHEIA